LTTLPSLSSTLAAQMFKQLEYTPIDDISQVLGLRYWECCILTAPPRSGRSCKRASTLEE
jgi:hypothetical protein